MLVVLTVVSTLTAVVMGVVAWRATRDERLRSAARVAVLAREIQGPALPAADPAVDFDLRPDAAGTGLRDLFSAPAPAASAGSRYGLALAVAAFIVVSVAAAAIVFSGGSPGTSVAAAPAQPASPSIPLELLALGHDRDGDRLTVRGIVRNPAGGAEIDRLIAVV